MAEGRRLPVLTVARLEAALRLIERLVDEKTDVFVARGQAFRDRYRDGSERPLSTPELAAVAAGLAVELDEAKRQVDAAGLVHHPDPTPQEVMFAAGVATAPEFLDAALRVVACIELPDDQFAEAYDDPDALDDAIDAHALDLRLLPVSEARARASATFAHVAREAGDAEGKGLGLVVQAIREALDRAAVTLGQTWQTGSSTGSAPPTGGPAGTSSTASPTGAPEPS